MKRLFILVMFCIAVAFSFTSCKKKGCKDPVSLNYDSEAKEDDGSCQYGGLGGNTTLVLFPKHHGVPIVSGDSAGYMDSAFIKFNAINLPGTLPSNYDIVEAGDSGENQVHIHDLKPGKYFIYMTGWDKSINQRVFGGIAYTLTQTSGEVELEIPVKED